MDRFSKFHPIVSFSFFMLVILFTVILNNPVYILISFISAFIYRLKTKKSSALISLKYIFPLIFFVGAFNMLFCHYGNIVLFSFSGYDFTLECFLYGLSTGIMLSAVILWFAAYSNAVTSEKFMALFGGLFPNLALLFSMVLRFIPLMIKISDEIKDANIGMGNEVKGIKNTLNRFSCLVSMSLEKSIETADSMKSRGFGSRKRRPYVRYRFSFSDGAVLALILFLAAVILISYIFKINFFDFSSGFEFFNSNFVFYIVFGLFASAAVIIDAAEDAKWLYLKSKI